MKLYFVNDGIYHFCQNHKNNLFCEYYIENNYFKCIRPITFKEQGSCSVEFPVMLSAGSVVEKRELDIDSSMTSITYYYNIGYRYMIKYDKSYDEKFALEINKNG